MAPTLTTLSPRYMYRAIDLALRSEGAQVSPNPRVGGVLVYGDRVIGEGAHRKAGEGHAEVNCFRSIRDEDRHLVPSSTLYVTLEPCAHEGRTPSCAKMLVGEKVGRVVIGVVDPNPLVAGKGVDILRDAGIPVITGFLEDECRELAKVFLTNQELRRPYILLKWAESRDGLLDRLRLPDEPSARLSSPFTTLLVHRLRSSMTGILVGRSTLEMDRPRLDNRLWTISPYSPKRLLLSRHEAPEGWIPVRELSTQSLRQLMDEEGITSIMVEGGRETLQSFIDLDLWDEIRVEVAPIVLNEGVPSPRIPSSAHLITQTCIDERVISVYSRVPSSPDPIIDLSSGN